MVAGAAIGALEAEAKGLGLAFYRVLAASLAKWMRVSTSTVNSAC
jgi:hypothetical protein